MSCKSGIYTANTRKTDVYNENILVLGSVVRRFGREIELSGDTIYVCDRGYYDADVNITFTGLGAGDATFTILVDGVAVPGATATVTVNSPLKEKNSVSIPAMIRNCDPCCRKAITVLVTGVDVKTYNVGIVVEKI